MILCPATVFRYCVFLVCLTFPALLKSQTFLSGYLFRNQITIQGSQVPSGQNNFPFLVLIEGTEFTSNLEGNVTSASGFDIVFTDNANTLLSHELVTYDEANDMFQAWVEVTLTGADQTIFMYYGNPSITTDQSDPDTWSEGFEAVWHFEDDVVSTNTATNSTIEGATFNATGDATGNDITSAAGQIGNSFSFPGTDNTDDFLSLDPGGTDLDIAGDQFTLSVWINPNDQGQFDDNNSQFSVIEKSDGTGANDAKYWIGMEENNNTELFLEGRVAVQGGNNTIQDDVGGVDLSQPGANSGWYYLTVVYNGANLIGYVDAVQVFNPAETGNLQVDAGDLLRIGARSDDRRYNGLIDEARVSSVSRTADWITTEFNNQSDPSSFFVLTAQESSLDVTFTASANFLIIPDNTVTFSVGGADFDLDATYTLQSSPDNMTFTNVAGFENQTAGTFTSPIIGSDTFFRIVVTNAGEPDMLFTSLPIFIDVEPAFAFPEFTNRRSITFNENLVFGEDNAPIETSHTDFPALITFTETDFRSISNGGQVTSEDGFDIIFTDSDASTLLQHDLESYDPVTGTVVFWVEIPSLDTENDDQIFVYYGNGGISTGQSTTDTWSNGFSGVWHMNQNPAVTRVFDFSGNGNDAVPVALESNDLVAGKISGGIDLDGFNADGGNVGEFLFVGAEDLVPSSLNITGQNITVSGWINPSDLSDNDQFSIIEKANGNQDVDIAYWLGRDGNDVQTRLGTPETTNNGLRLNSNPLLATDTWFYIAMTYEGAGGADNYVLYVNGQSANTDTRTGNIISDPLDEFFIGGRDDGSNRFFEGIIDELRVADVTRSAGWIETEFQNQCFPSSFLTLEDARECPDPVDGGVATATDGAIFIGETTSIVLSGQTGGTTIQWQESTDGINFTDIPGETGTQLNVGPLTQTTFYKAEVTNGVCTAFSTDARVKATEPILEGFSFRKCVEINPAQVIDDGDSDNALLNFPVLIDIRNDPDLSPDNVDRSGDFASMAQPFPLDIVFSDVSGSLLTFEIEEFSFNGTASGNLRAWVLVPSLSTVATTKIFLNYGNCNVIAGGSPSVSDNGNSIINSTNTNTWNNSFFGVWHLQDDLNIADATVNNLDGTIQAGPLVAGTGQIGNSIDLPGGDNQEFIRIEDGAMITAPAQVENFAAFTLSGWVNTNANNNEISLIELSNGTNTNNGDIKYFLGLDGGDVEIRASVGNSAAQSIQDDISIPLQDVNDGEWHYIAVTYDGVELTTFIDGNLAGISDNTSLDGNINSETDDELRIGARNDARRFNGNIDEIRIASAARGAGWLLTEYNNQLNPVIDLNTPANNGNFYALGDEESFVLWTDDAANNNWSDADNWGICRLPNEDETVRIADPAEIGGANPTYDLAGDEIGGLLIESNGNLNFSVPGNTLTLNGDLTNNSGGTFAPPGTITFGGTETQSIQGTDPSIFGNLVIDNSAGVNIDEETTITTSLTFSSGFLTLTDDSLVLNSTAAILGSSSTSFIVTPFDNCLIQQGLGNGGRQDVEFPLGTSSTSYTPAIIDNDGTIDDYCVYVDEGFFPGDLCGPAATTDDMVIDRTWFIDESVDGGSDVTLTLQWNASNELGSFNRSSAFFTHLEPLGCTDVGSVTVIGADPLTASLSGLTSFSPYSVASEVTVLPVSFVSFDARQVNNGISLFWTTASETNNERFAIERADNTLQFEEIGSVTGAGNSNRLIDYEYTDNTVTAGEWFYRLRQIDFDGQFDFSRVLRVVIDAGANKLDISPNPNSGAFTVRGYEFTPNAFTEIQIMDIDGRVLLRRVFVVDESEHFEENFNLNLKNGLYLVSVKSLSETYTQRIAITN